MKVATICIGIFAALTAATPVMAFDQAAAQQACGNDVYALCQQAVPDHKRITACLQRRFKQVSAPCRRFMAASDAEMRRARRGATR
jgi:Cysteine rich repeat